MSMDEPTGNLIDTIIEDVPSPYAIFTRDGALKVANRRFHDWRKFRDADYGVAAALQSIVARERRVSADLEGHSVDLDIDEKPGGYLALTVRDRDRGQAGLTENNGSEAALKSSEALLSAIMDNVPALIYLKDLDGRHLHANPAVLNRHQKSAEDFVGKRPHDVFPADIADELVEFLPVPSVFV